MVRGLKIGLIALWVTWVGGAAEAPTLSWTNNLLTLRDSRLPGGQLNIWYLEAFLRNGTQQREWGKSTLPHRTELLSASADGRALKFRTRVEPAVEVLHEVRAGSNEVDFTFTLVNNGAEPSPIQWFQPACIRVADFTGQNQAGYITRSFVFTTNGLTTLNHMSRTTNAWYLGGQVYLPPATLPADANPRPLAGDRVVNGLIGCYSADGRWLLATASDHTHELFEGVYVCLHSDPFVGGLKPGETKRVRQKLYLMPNDPAALIQRYRSDFPEAIATSF